MRTVWTIAILTLLLCTPASFATDNPLDPKTDPRLEKEITAFHPPAPLSAVVRSLSTQSGILLTTERSISSYRAILVAEEKPLHEVLRKLAEAFGFVWERKGKEGEPPSYMLVQPPADAAREAAELREMERLAEEMWRYAAAQAQKWATEGKAAAQARLDELRKTYEARVMEGKVSRAELLSMLKETMAAHAAQTPWSRACILALASLPPARLNALRSGEMVRVTGDSFAPDALRVILEEWSDAQIPAPVRPDEPTGQTEQPARSQQWDNVEVWLFPDPAEGNIKALVYFVGAGVRQGGSNIHEVTPSVLDLALRVNGILRGMIQPRLPDAELLRKPTKVAEFNRTSNEYLLDPIGVELAHFARTNRVSLAAEWYPFSLGGRPDIRELRKVGSWGQLPTMLREHMGELAVSDGWVLVQCFARSTARRTNIPQEQTARWLLKPQAAGALSLDDCAEIAFLPERQREMLQGIAARLLHRDTSPRYAIGMETPRAPFALQAYALLTAAQKRALLNGQPVPLAAMPRQAAARLQLAAVLPDTQFSPLPPDAVVQMALVMHSETTEAERIDWSQVPEEMRESGAFRQWLNNLSLEERAKVVKTFPLLQVALILTDGEREIPVARLSVIQ